MSVSSTVIGLWYKMICDKFKNMPQLEMPVSSTVIELCCKMICDKVKNMPQLEMPVSSTVIGFWCKMICDKVKIMPQLEILGADHDGEDSAIACDPNDLFIMTPKETVFSRGQPYSRNPWMFSNCSVDAFKKTLKYKYVRWLS
ncbi:hypothetical protein CHS0354_034472 [Potamilus streckersoni]|uniref:Uncharacterized protein n=1 Tax=Potamilus streckersoni TaxID=2493646 RepID=A0AAE0VF53_9BIVA|nr:hypothetical protein CHS0354_034472 [Potamilus streckersoni]